MGAEADVIFAGAGVLTDQQNRNGWGHVVDGEPESLLNFRIDHWRLEILDGPRESPDGITFYVCREPRESRLVLVAGGLGTTRMGWYPEFWFK